MKQDIATYVVDSFIDYAGKEHKFVACALSQSPEGEDSLMVNWVSPLGYIVKDASIQDNIYRLVTIGIAICNPDDVFDLEKGKKLARNKAANIETLPRIYTTNKGVITQELVDTFLKQQIQFFKENPETLIKGYKEAKEAYEAVQKAKEEINKLTDEEKVVFNLAVKGVDFGKYSKLARIYLKKILNK